MCTQPREVAHTVFVSTMEVMRLSSLGAASARRGRLPLLFAAILVAAGLAHAASEFVPLEPVAFRDGEAAIAFFLPDQCPACDLLAEWASTEYNLPVPLYFVSHAPAGELASWMERHPNLRVVHDERSSVGQALGVTEVPSVFMLTDGNVVNADYWPFFGGLDGLALTIEMSFALEHGDIAKVLDYARFADLVAYDVAGNRVLIGDLALPATFVLCSTTCSVCSEEALWLSEIGLALDTYVLVLSTNPASTNATAWDNVDGVTVLHVDSEALAPTWTPLHFRLGTGYEFEGGLVGFAPELVRSFLTSTGDSQ